MILAFDTCLDGCSVALGADGAVLAGAADRRARGQAERLVPMIESVLQRAGVTGGDISGLATTVGPGSFTGARIGVAAARGLSLAWDCPALGVTTLELLAVPARRSGMAGRLVACLPARNDTCFMQVIGPAGMGESPPQLMSIPDLRRFLESAPTVLCCPDPDHPPCSAGWSALAPRLSESPAASLLGLAAELPATRWAITPAPVYARAPDALPSTAGRLVAAAEAGS